MLMTMINFEAEAAMSLSPKLKVYSLQYCMYISYRAQESYSAGSEFRWREDFRSTWFNHDKNNKLTSKADYWSFGLRTRMMVKYGGFEG